MSMPPVNKRASKFKAGSTFGRSRVFIESDSEIDSEEEEERKSQLPQMTLLVQSYKWCNVDITAEDLNMLQSPDMPIDIAVIIAGLYSIFYATTSQLIVSKDDETIYVLDSRPGADRSTHTTRELAKLFTGTTAASPLRCRLERFQLVFLDRYTQTDTSSCGICVLRYAQQVTKMIEKQKSVKEGYKFGFEDDLQIQNFRQSMVDAVRNGGVGSNFTSLLLPPVLQQKTAVIEYIEHIEPAGDAEKEDRNDTGSLPGSDFFWDEMQEIESLPASDIEFVEENDTNTETVNTIKKEKTKVTGCDVVSYAENGFTIVTDSEAEIWTDDSAPGLNDSYSDKDLDIWTDSERELQTASAEASNSDSEGEEGC